MLTVTREDILEFLDSRKKSMEQDPDQKWIVTWNNYLGRLKGFYRWLCNKDKELEREVANTTAFKHQTKEK